VMANPNLRCIAALHWRFPNPIALFTRVVD
jgi:hypothetical protein